MFCVSELIFRRKDTLLAGSDHCHLHKIQRPVSDSADVNGVFPGVKSYVTDRCHKKHIVVAGRDRIGIDRIRVYNIIFCPVHTDPDISLIGSCQCKEQFDCVGSCFLCADCVVQIVSLAGRIAELVDPADGLECSHIGALCDAEVRIRN